MAFTFKHGDRPLAGYEIQRGVGRGGFGEVYYAISDGGREVALKYLREHPEVELRGVAQCINLKSPHLVSIFDVKQNDEGEYFVVMEYISGPALRDMLIAEPNGLGPQKAAFFVREIAKGLGYLHDRGIVHRDLKPGNIFYDEGYVKICDYGLSKFISISRHSAQTTSIGTVHYMAPEVGSGNYSKTIDIYALGVVLYEMLMGKVPYEGSSMGEILMKHLTDQPEVDQLPSPFGSVIKKALAKDPKERYQDVHEMVEDIFEFEDVKQSVMGFEPTSLTMLAARAADDIRPSPVPSDSPRRADAPRDRKRRVPQTANDFSRRFVERTGGLDPWMTKQERRRARKDKRKRRRSREKAPELLGKEDEPDDLVRSPYRIGFGRRLGRLFAAMLVAGGLAFGIGVVSDDAELAGVSLAIIMTSVVGIGIGNKIANWLGPDHPQLISRLLVLAFAAPAAAIVYGAVCDGGVGRGAIGYELQHLYVPLLGAFALFNWRERIRSGQGGDLGIWTGVWTGFLAFVASTAVSDSESAGIWMGVVVGSISLVLQTFSWAMIRNPRRVSDSPEAAVGLPDDAVLPGSPEATAAQDARRLDADEGTYAVAGIVIGDDRYRDLPPQHIRSKALRVTAGVLSCCSALGIIALSILLGVGQIGCGSDEQMGAIVGIVAQSLFFLFWLGTTTRIKRVGAWNEWMNPILRVGVGTALAAGITGLSILNLHGDEFAAFIILVVFSSLAFLALLVFRQSKRKQLRKYRRRGGDDDRFDDGGAPRGDTRDRPHPLAKVREEISSIVDEVSDVVSTIASKDDFIIPAKAWGAKPAAPIPRSWLVTAGALLMSLMVAGVLVSSLTYRRSALVVPQINDNIVISHDGGEVVAKTFTTFAPRTHRASVGLIAVVAGLAAVAICVAFLMARSRRRYRHRPG